MATGVEDFDHLFQLSHGRAPWPCPACGATTIKAAYLLCRDDTGHSDCAHSVVDTPCPNDALFEEIE